MQNSLPFGPKSFRCSPVFFLTTTGWCLLTILFVARIIDVGRQTVPEYWYSVPLSWIRPPFRAVPRRYEVLKIMAERVSYLSLEPCRLSLGLVWCASGLLDSNWHIDRVIQNGRYAPYHRIQGGYQY